MDKPALFRIIVLVLVIAAQAHALECQETISPSPGASSFAFTIRTRDPARDTAGKSRDTESSFPGHDAKIVGADRDVVMCSKFEASTPTSSASSSAPAAVESHLSRAPSPKLPSSSLGDVDATPDAASRYRDINAATSGLRHESSVSGVRDVKSNVDNSTFVLTAAPQASVLSNTPLSYAPVEKIPQGHPVKSARTVVHDSSHDSGNTVGRSVERVPVKSSFLELSSSPRQDEGGTDPTSVTSSTSKETASTAKASTADQPASSKQTKAGSSPSSSASSANRLLFYSCLVVGVAGLVGAALVYSIEWRAGAKHNNVAATPRTTWSPRPSEVHVVMDGRNFAIL